MSNLLKRFFRFVLPALLLIGIVALALNEREKKKSEQEEYEQSQANEIKEEKIYEQNKTNEISHLVSKYNIKYNWDTLSYEFSLEYRPVINSGYQLATRVELLDVFEKDGVAYALMRIGRYQSFYIEFPISKEQEGKLLGNNNGGSCNCLWSSCKCLLVVDITSVQKIKYELASVVRENGENASLVIDDSEDFFGKGTIVDIVFISKNK